MSVHFSSKSIECGTPKHVFYTIDSEFHFTLDVCASQSLAKCDRYFDKETNGLKQSWANEVCWMNPPYGKMMPYFLGKAFREATFKGATVVALIPVRTDTKAWHRYVMQASEIRFIEGRLNFDRADLSEDGQANTAPFPSCIVVWRPKKVKYALQPRVISIKFKIPK